jgi:fumarylacetoacetase
MYEINETHDPNLKSWVESANDPDTDFPIQNLPLCWFFHRDDSERMKRAGIVIGDMVIDLAECLYDDLFAKKGSPEYQAISGYTTSHSLNWPVLTTSDDANKWMRRKLVGLLSDSSPIDVQNAFRKNMFPLSEVEFSVPLDIANYTDFYCSIFHATNVGSMFRPDQPLMPNYKYVPIGYHGRASSIVVSGTDIKRPKGQNRSDAEKPPVFVPAKNLDYEMELGFFVGRGNEMGEPIPIAEAEEHIFGMCLVNDWSARDIQAWEYQPLGPFLAKNFATTVSPFVVTMEALAPFRTAAFKRPEGDPEPLDYLSDENSRKFGGLDINFEVYIETEQMRNENIKPHLLSRSNAKDLYWTVGQMLTHHASNGCNLQTGDLIASGTVSGKEKNERGCLLELTWRGTEPIELPSGETRRFLEDGDEIIMKGYCEREGFRRIGFGECRGRILPAD